MYVEDVEDIKSSHNRFLTDFLVKGVEDILQILSDFKALNTIYVEDVEDRSNTPVMLCMSKTSKILKQAITDF